MTFVPMPPSNAEEALDQLAEHLRRMTIRDPIDSTTVERMLARNLEEIRRVIMWWQQAEYMRLATQPIRFVVNNPDMDLLDVPCRPVPCRIGEEPCQINEPHCSMCGQTNVSCEAHGYSSCCNEPITDTDGCQYPELHHRDPQ